jgi:hypothetical protein
MSPGGWRRKAPTAICNCEFGCWSTPATIMRSMAPGGFTPQVNMAGESTARCLPPIFALRFQAAGGVAPTRWDWIENFDLPVERERGLPDRDAPSLHR